MKAERPTSSGKVTFGCVVSVLLPVRLPLPSFNPVKCDFLLFVVADDGCAEFRLASCGQDSLLKIWMVSQREGAGGCSPR